MLLDYIKFLVVHVGIIILIWTGISIFNAKMKGDSVRDAVKSMPLYFLILFTIFLIGVLLEC